MSNETKAIEVINSANDSIKLTTGILAHLDNDQIAALERKAALLPSEVQESMRVDGLSIAEQYILRQMRKEANNALASKLRPVWIMQVKMYAVTLNSKDENLRKNSEKVIAKLADEIGEPKEVIKVLTAVRTQLLNATSDIAGVVENVATACKIFGVKPESLLK